MEDLLKEEVIKLEGELTKLKTAVEYIETAKISIESASKIINTIVELKTEFDELSGKAYSLIDKLNKVDFPSRLERIDSNLLKTLRLRNNSFLSFIHNVKEIIIRPV